MEFVAVHPWAWLCGRTMRVQDGNKTGLSIFVIGKEGGGMLAWLVLMCIVNDFASSCARWERVIVNLNVNDFGSPPDFGIVQKNPLNGNYLKERRETTAQVRKFLLLINLYEKCCNADATGSLERRHYAIYKAFGKRSEANCGGRKTL